MISYTFVVYFDICNCTIENCIVLFGKKEIINEKFNKMKMLFDSISCVRCI